MTWDELKKNGNSKYKTGTCEPIDLYRANGSLQHFAIDNIIKYAFRNSNGAIKIADIEKIKHYADMLLVIATEIEFKPSIKYSYEDLTAR